MSKNKVVGADVLENGEKRGKAGVLRFFLRNGPLAIAASSLPGFVNYFIILYLTYRSSAAEVGDYRILMSFFALAGLVSVQESSKVVIRSTAMNDRDSYATIFLIRLVFSSAALVATLLVWALSDAIGWDFPPAGLIPIVLMSALFYPLDIFNSYFQAKRQFMTMSLVALAKYLMALVVFMVALWLGASAFQATLWQIASMVLFHLVFFANWIGRDVWESLRASFDVIGRLKSKPSRESIVLSIANLLPSSLEHVDKIVIGSVFGLEALGLYTLGFSTGRFIYNALKPALYIYYAQFVEKMPTVRMLWAVMVVFTLFGLALTGAFLWSVDNLAFMHKFQGTKLVTAIMFLSYGVAMVDAIYLQAYAINKDTNSNHLLVSNTISGFGCLLLFAAASQTTAYTAMIICSMHYPIRHGATVMIVSALRRREESRRLVDGSKPSAELSAT
ncbi:lipopolysaccharide biosynthesis protein [Aureimonas sp. AU12]|uniref:lipopolysaccharide biosynthesis protein n=1 Tax=Aureimonas sp. AU12 TaxID=1638161 RepID=UPI00078445BF|nr:hypothetical protein [Aureimonas sp. AU12]